MMHGGRSGSAAGLLRRVAICAMLGLPAGCSVSQPFPDRATFVLNPGKPVNAAATQAGATQGAGPALTLRVLPLRIAKPYDSQLFNYKIGPDQFTQDYYAGFIAPPADLLGPQMIAWLEDSGAVKYAVAAGSSLDCSASLESQISALYADHTNHTAVIELRVFVLSNAAGPTRVLMERVYREAEPIASLTPESLVQAWSAAYRNILEKLTADVAALPAASP